PDPWKIASSDQTKLGAIQAVLFRQRSRTSTYPRPQAPTPLEQVAADPVHPGFSPGLFRRANARAVQSTTITNEDSFETEGAELWMTNKAKRSRHRAALGMPYRFAHGTKKLPRPLLRVQTFRHFFLF